MKQCSPWCCATSSSVSESKTRKRELDVPWSMAPTKFLCRGGISPVEYVKEVGLFAICE